MQPKVDWARAWIDYEQLPVVLRTPDAHTSGNTRISFHGLYKLVQAPKVSKVTSRQARSIFCQVDEILY